jgi:hypothetical protein
MRTLEIPMRLLPMSRRLLTLLCAAVLLLEGGGLAEAQDLNWAERMFSALRHDFGTVAKGADARHTITVQNVYEENVRLLNVGTTCGCTAAKPDKDLLKTGEVARIEVQMNTVKFSHQKNSNVDVTLSFTDKRGLTASKTVRIPIAAYIRTDVTVEPGGVNFGSVGVGAGARQQVDVSYTGGRNNWHITRVETASPYLQAQAVESRRGGGRAQYNLVVQVKPDAPEGVLRDKIILHTDDAQAPQIPVLVEARIEPDIVVSPSIVSLGPDLKPGEEKTYTVVLKGREPFAIEKIECNSAHECFKVRLSPDPKKVHVLPLTFSPPNEPGDFKEEFTITVAGRAEPLVIRAQGTIIASTTAATAN